MRSLISDLLVYSRVATRERTAEPVNLSKLLKEVLDDLAVQIAETEAQVETGPLPTISGDASLLRQLLQNLLGNALKFRRDGEPPRIAVNGALRNGVCELTVEDNGIGLADQHSERVFGMFQRLHGRDQYEGSGVGLAICRKIVERHHGTIAARGVPGRGTTFTAILPVHSPNPAEARHDEQE